MRLIDADEINMSDISPVDGFSVYGATAEDIELTPTLQAIPKEKLEDAFDYVEEYVCNQEKDTVKAQGMCKALELIEQYLKEHEEADESHKNENQRAMDYDPYDE